MLHSLVSCFPELEVKSSGLSIHTLQHHEGGFCTRAVQYMQFTNWALCMSRTVCSACAVRVQCCASDHDTLLILKERSIMTSERVHGASSLKLVPEALVAFELSSGQRRGEAPQRLHTNMGHTGTDLESDMGQTWNRHRRAQSELEVPEEATGTPLWLWLWHRRGSLSRGDPKHAYTTRNSPERTDLGSVSIEDHRPQAFSTVLYKELT